MKSTDKIKNYLENYTREKYFTDRIFQIRKDIGIPQKGIKFSKKLFSNSVAGVTEEIGMLLSIKYKNTIYLTYPAKMSKVYRELLKPIPKIYQEMEMILFINIFILYNKRYYKAFSCYYNGVRDTISLIEFRNAYLERKDCCDCELKVCEDYMDHESKKYPVMLGISPYATQNEVIDLVKKRWKDIQDHMTELEKDKHINSFKKEKSRLIKIRKRESESKEIEDIVYDNRTLSLKKIGDIIEEKTGKFLDVGEIGKIKSLAIKRREKNRK